MNAKKFIPHIASIVAFLLISVIYFSPLMGGKKVIKQYDITQFKGMAKEIQDFRKAHNGEEPLWTNSTFSGMPAYQISASYSANWIRYIDNILKLGLPHPVGLVFLYFLGFYILMLCLRINPWLAAIAAFAYGFSSYFFIILEVGHNTKAHAIAYMAPLLGGILVLLRRNIILGVALTTLFASLELYANHVQITYYLFMIVASIVAVEFFHALKHKYLPSFFKRVGLMAVAILIGFLPGTTNLWATYEYGKYSTRGTSDLTIKSNGQSNADVKTSGLDRDYATMYSYGVSESMSLFIPNFKGGVSEALSNSKTAMDAIKDPQMKQYAGSMSAYFGEQAYTAGPVYVGAIMIFLAVLGLFLIKDQLKWSLLIITIVGIALAWGRNFMGFSNIFFDYFPGYNKFRAVSMIMVIAELTIPILAALALQRVYESTQNSEVMVFNKKMNLGKVLIIAASITGGVALICWLAPDAVNRFQAEGELRQIAAQVQQQNPGVTMQQVENTYGPVLEQAELGRKAIFRADAVRTLIFILLALGALWLYLTKKINERILFAALAVFVLADMWGVTSRYLNDKNYVAKVAEAEVAKSKADEMILTDNTLDYRVYNLAKSPFNDATTSYYHKSIGGYHGAKLKRYQELIDFHIDRNTSAMMQALRSGGVSDSSLRAAFSKTQVLNMLNTKYIILQEDAPPLVNPQANGNAWFVNNVVTANSADEEITKLGEINTKTTAIVNSKYSEAISGFKPEADSSASIKLTSYQPNKLVYESNAHSNGLAVFSEIYYPKGWIATIDGKETPYVNADYVLRAMVIPAGKHTVEFSFQPAVYKTGEAVSMAGSALVFLVSFGGMFLAYRKKEVADKESAKA